MAAFSTMADAEEFGRTGVEAGTYIQAHPCRTEDGTIAVRVQKPKSPTAMDAGGWEIITDDA